jgi:triosephosphate isomerase
MRKSIVAGNWKMNKNLKEARALYESLQNALKNSSNEVEVIIAPPAIYLSEFASKKTGGIQLSSQDVSAHADEGAYTGELSSAMLQAAGISHAIVGHSERRSYHGEDDNLISKKIEACLSNGVIPIYCCGETLDEREEDRHISVVKSQLNTALSPFEANELKSLIVAYEPVWAIGTGKTASADQAQEMHKVIRDFLEEKFGVDFAKNCRILYGGSCKPSNAESLFSQDDVDGGLIGGASLNSDDFLKLIEIAGQ